MDTYFDKSGLMGTESSVLFTDNYNNNNGSNSDVIITFRDDKDNNCYICFVTGRKMQLMVVCNRRVKHISSELVSLFSETCSGIISDVISSNVNVAIVEMMVMMSHRELNLEEYKKHYNTVNDYFTNIYFMIRGINALV